MWSGAPGKRSYRACRPPDDPFYPVVIAAFALIGLGSIITFAGKLGEIKA